MRMINLFILLSVLTVMSCKKDSASGNRAPSNLAVNATVNTDNSGNVSFTATAQNAISFDFDFGDGFSETSQFGVVSHRYQVSGTYTVSVTARSSSGQTVSKSIQVTVQISSGLIWADEFDTPGTPDESRWGYEVGDGCPSNCGWGNNELQYYTSRPDNVIVSNGTLKIIAKREGFSGKDFTSARLVSKNKFSFRYGKVEVRAKLPAGVGTWPAIWMLGTNINTAGWPACGEIDIMEHRGSQLNVIHGSLHYPGFSGGNANTGSINVNNVTTEFHIYSLEWSSTQIRILADGQLVHTVQNNGTLPFNQPFFFILNVAMGGNFGGQVDPSFSSSTMEIDYVRVYQ